MIPSQEVSMKLAFIGGTGPEGLGLAMRFAKAGHEVAIGSRSAERGVEGAERVREAVPGATTSGGDNSAVIADADVIFLTFPYSGQEATLAALAGALAGKIICNVVAPLEFQQGVGAVALNVPGKSALQEAIAQLPDSRVVSAFQNMSAEELQHLEQPIEADVLVCGRDAEAKEVVIGLANQIAGVRGIDAGGPSQSRYVEMLTSLLINLNRKHKTQSSIRIVGI
jgi:8-hydroxy-5-deazaflavin:NADPH oxidoreductase